MDVKTFQPGAFLFQGEFDHRQMPAPIAHWTPRFITFKFIFDKGFALAMLPVIAFVGLLLLVLNPFFNGGRDAGPFDSTIYRNSRLRDRPLVNTAWDLIINRRSEEANADLNLQSLTDIRLFIYYSDFTAWE